MKCHYIYDKTAGKVLIPGCWSVVNSGNMRDCTCRNRVETFEQFEKKEYQKILLEKNKQISELEKEVTYLNRLIKKLLQNKS